MMRRLKISFFATTLDLPADAEIDVTITLLHSCCLEHGSRGERINCTVTDVPRTNRRPVRRLTWNPCPPGIYLITQLPINSNKTAQKLFEICGGGRVRHPRFEEAARRLSCETCEINAKIVMQSKEDDLPPLAGTPRQRLWGLHLRQKLLDQIENEAATDAERAAMRRRALEIRDATAFIVAQSDLGALIR